ncbi:MAG: thiamine pyrophosphate-binding protein [Bacteroidota bacterium]
MKDTAAAILAQYLEQENAKYLFGVPGAHILPIYDAMYRTTSIQPILTKHEVGGAFMAYGYAAVTGNLGVCCGTVGPGATNLVSGVAAAHLDSIPMLVITGQVGTKAFGRSAHQESTGYGRSIDQNSIFKDITKMSVMITDKDAMSRTLRTAIRGALSGRPGPVHIDFPSNIQLQEINEEILPPESYRPVNKTHAPNIDQIKTIADLLYNSENPAMLIGYGASKCANDGIIIELAEKLQIPVATSGKAKGVFPEDHPLSVGCLSIRGSKAANTYLKSAIDVLLVVGTDLSEMTSHGWDPKLQPSKALIQIDIDPNEIGKNYPVQVGLVADAREALHAINSNLSELPPKSKRDLASFKKSSQYYNEPVSFSNHIPMKPQRLMRELRNSLPRNTLIFGDMGNTYSWILRYFQSYPEGMNFLPSGMACMGSSVAACMGGKLGRPESPVVCICGDGDFLMTGMEVLTAVDYKIPVIWIILKNNRLGAIHDVQALSYQGRISASIFNEIDFVSIAKAFGAHGFRVEKPEDIASTVREALEINGPVILEAIIDPEEKFPITRRSISLKDSIGLPKLMNSISTESILALFKMYRNKEK